MVGFVGVWGESRENLLARGRLNRHLWATTSGEPARAGAEGATAPETLRPPDRRRYDDSGERHNWCPPKG